MLALKILLKGNPGLCLTHLLSISALRVTILWPSRVSLGRWALGAVTERWPWGLCAGSMATCFHLPRVSTWVEWQECVSQGTATHCHGSCPCNLPGMWVPTSAWHSALLLYPSQQRCGRVSLALLCVLLMMGTVEHLPVGAPAVPVSSFVRNLSQPHAFVLLGAPLLRVRMLCIRLLCRRVSQPELTFLFCYVT